MLPPRAGEKHTANHRSLYGKKMISEQAIKKGQAIYTPLSLKIYNLWVVCFSNSFIWRCHRRHLLELHNKYISQNHCDIGVGTAYYLQRCQWQTNSTVSLLDINPHSLACAQQKIASLNPSAVRADIFKPQPSLKERFDSISITYLLHCLPGDMSDKTLVIKHSVDMLKSGGILFGATILSDACYQSTLSRGLMSFYNKKGVFSNTADTKQSLLIALEAYLSNVSISVIGCVALFQGVKR